MKPLFAILIFGVLFPSGLFSQESASEKELNISLCYSIPRFDNYFRGGFESRIGGSGGLNIIEGRLSYGVKLTFQRFTKRINNSVDVSRALFWMLDGHVGYDLLKNSKNRLEPLVGTGVAHISYNAGRFQTTSFYLYPGLNYLLAVENNYYLEVGGAFYTIFDKFGSYRNTYDSSMMQMIKLKLGLTFIL